MSLLQIIILGIVQGAAELLPVSSSAHVIVAEKLMGIVPGTPEAMFVLAMLHTGTMFAVLAYFWKSWGQRYFSSAEKFKAFAPRVIVATVISGVLTEIIVKIIEKAFLTHTGTGDIEELSNNLWLIAGALVVAGIWIIVAGVKRAEPVNRSHSAVTRPHTDVTMPKAVAMGLAQGVCLPFRGLSRSGGTISTGLLTDVARRPAEEFSFALAFLITPAVIAREFLRLRKAYPESLHHGTLGHLLTPGFIGLVAAFLAGLAALKLLSHWLEEGRWRYFGYYCIAAAILVFVLAANGF